MKIDVDVALIFVAYECMFSFCYLTKNRTALMTSFQKFVPHILKFILRTPCSKARCFRHWTELQ